MASRVILGLDIGTASTKVAVAEKIGNRPVPRLVFKIPSSGVEKSTVVDIAEASRMVSHALTEARKISKATLKNAYVNLGTYQVKCQNSRGIIAVSRADAEIYQDDVDRVVRASQAVNAPANWMIVHHVPREFIVDGIGDIPNPLGLTGSRLEVQSVLITAFSRPVKDIMKVIEVNGGHIAGLVCDPIATSRAVLSKKQKHLGTVVIDMGAGTTGVSVYEENKLLGTSVVPMGAGHVTNDIAVGLKIPVTVAEKIKLAHGYAIPSEISTKETIELEKYDPTLRGTVSRRFLADIIEARLAETLDLVDNELKVMTKAVQLPGGAVLVGGGAKLPGVTQLVKQRLKLASQVGLPLSEEWAAESQSFSEYFEDPEFVNVLGLILTGADKEGWYVGGESLSLSPKGIARFVRYFLP